MSFTGTGLLFLYRFFYISPNTAHTKQTSFRKITPIEAPFSPRFTGAKPLDFAFTSHCRVKYNYRQEDARGERYMKVVFLENVPNVANTGEIKEVADGYGRNYLLPKKLAILAGPHAMSIVEAQQRKKARVQAETEAEFAKLGEELEGKEITIKAKTAAEDRLYGSVTSTMIAAELEKDGIVVDKKKIELDEPIHQLGTYEIAIKLSKDIAPTITVHVAEEEKEQSAG